MPPQPAYSDNFELREDLSSLSRILVCKEFRSLHEKQQHWIHGAQLKEIRQGGSLRGKREGEE